MVAGPQADVVIAPGYEPGAIEALQQRSARTRGSSRRPPPEPRRLDFRQISRRLPRPGRRTTSRRRATTGGSSPRSRPPPSSGATLELAWRICGHVKSNAIVLVKDGQAVGIGAGQQNRVESGEIAAKKAAGRAAGGACASDAFYPFPDGIEAAAAAGRRGRRSNPAARCATSKIIERADELGLAMVFTGERHFLH